MSWEPLTAAEEATLRQDILELGDRAQDVYGPDTIRLLKTLDRDRALASAGLTAERLAQAMQAEGIAPFRSRANAEAHGPDVRWLRNARDLLTRLGQDPT